MTIYIIAVIVLWFINKTESYSNGFFVVIIVATVLEYNNSNWVLNTWNDQAHFAE